jgi:hypothetical protein
MANPPHIDPPRPPLYDPVTQLGLPNYNVASLNNRETRIVYLRGELEMRRVSATLRAAELDLEKHARRMFALRNAIRSWTRDLMHNRADAECLASREQNSTFEALFAEKRAEVDSDDEAYEAMIESSTKSRPVANGEIDPDNPPPLPPVWPSFPIWGQPSFPCPPPKRPPTSPPTLTGGDPTVRRNPAGKPGKFHI